eukprot:709480-Amphidinium_carterae.1
MQVQYHMILLESSQCKVEPPYGRNENNFNCDTVRFCRSIQCIVVIPVTYWCAWSGVGAGMTVSGSVKSPHLQHHQQLDSVLVPHVGEGMHQTLPQALPTLTWDGGDH